MSGQVNMAQVNYEFHIIAMNYHWTPDIIWGLAISERKKWVEMIEEYLKMLYEAKGGLP